MTNAGRVHPWRRIVAGASIALLLLAGRARAESAADTASLLATADTIKLRDPAKFDFLMGEVSARLKEISEEQRQYFLLLQGWKSAYEGKDALAVTQLSRLAATSPSVTIRFRAYAMLSNLFTAQRRYREAFQDLSEAQSLLPRVSSPRARAEGLLDAAELYSQVGQYNLALNAAQAVIDQNWAGEGACMGGQQKLQALFNSGRLREYDAQVTRTIDACLKIAQPAYANEIRVDLAARYIAAGRLDQARRLLEEYYPQVTQMGYSRQVASFDSLLALVNQRKGNLAAARRFAAHAVQVSIPGEFPQSLISAYLILYQYAKQRGEYATALGYHEKYLTAKIGYLNDVSARQLAYERVKQDELARKLEIEALSRKNSVLELERKLAAKKVEATRLYGVILTLILAFIGLWALLTKRSQLHFKNLSRLDGLTSISNRLHFIERAEAALAYAKKSGHEVSLVLFDLDHFKSINDRFGHATGDFVLKRTAALCKEYLRRSDLFGRFGGEEFSVLLPGCRLDGALEQAEQLRQAINGIQAVHRGATVTASASFGIASSASSGYDLARLLAHADSALYRAKRAGRNCAMAYDAAESGEIKAIVPPPQPDGSPSPQA
jgi:diguanylate cyclase (GGDEF)-like protein